MRLLCLDCGAETVDPPPGTKACPSCGESSIPADLDDTATITLTTHELRILTMWADNYARTIGCGHVTRTILDRLAPQTDAALSLSQEFADLRAALPDSTVTVYRGGRPTDE